MLICRFCLHKTPLWKSHLDHHHYHKNLSHEFHCGFNGCEVRYKIQTRLTTHLYKFHNLSVTQQHLYDITSNENACYTCKVDLCPYKSQNYQSFIKHLKDHISDGVIVKCPASNCSKSYSILSSFTSHLSRAHRSIVSYESPQNRFTVRSITGREEFITADNLDEIIQKSVEKLGLSSMEYKLTWQGTEIKDYEVLQEWIKQFGNPPSMLILPREEEPSHFATNSLSLSTASDASSSSYLSQQPEMTQHPGNISETGEINIPPETPNHSEVIDVIISNKPTLRNVTHNGGSTASINPGMASTSVQSLANNRYSSHPAPFPWCQVPSKIIEVCEKKFQLMPCLLNRIAHIAVDHMDNTPNANMLRIAGQIAEQLCKKYPDSFCDVITNNQGKTTMGTGYESLKNKIYNTYGNRKRLARRESSTDIPVSTDNGRKRKRRTSEDLDEFGCIEWEPHLPPEETLESQSQLKKFLKQSQHQNNRDDAKIREALNTSYPTQRVDINRRTESIPKILTEWPILTQPRYFLIHSSKLLGFSNVDSVFCESIEYQSIIHSYMNTHQLQKADKSTKSLENIRDILCEVAKAMNDLGQNFIHISIIPLLVAYFDENPDYLFRIVDSNTTKEELGALVTTPTPVLIMMGQSLYDANATYVVYIDQDECIYPTNAFQGFLIVFLAYYVFGLEYAGEVKTTLEFIQRLIPFEIHNDAFFSLKSQAVELCHKKIRGIKWQMSSHFALLILKLPNLLQLLLCNETSNEFLT